MPQNQFQPGEIKPDDYYRSASLDLILDLCEKGETAHAQHLAGELLARSQSCTRSGILRKVFAAIELSLD
jgi:hypothetical protein